MTGKYFLLIVLFLFFQATLFAQRLNNKDSFQEKSIAERVQSHKFPSIARPWGECIDISNNNRIEEISKHDIVWESIGKENSKPGNRAAGANWKGHYPALGESFSNVNDALARRKQILKLNPDIIILAELRWRDYMDSSLPQDHEYWKRDNQGNRIAATGDKMALPRYYLDTNNSNLIDHLCKQAKCIVESGIYDGVFLDWFGPSAAFFKKLRETIGDKYLIITNSNYKYDAERAKYINGAYMECYKVNNPEVLPLWEQSVCSPKINVVDMMGEQVNCVGEPDLKRMRNTTTFTLIHSNAYVLYGDHFHKHHWFSFWDTNLGEPKADKQMIVQGVFKRAFKNGVVVNNSGKTDVAIEFDKPMKRISDNTIAASFKIEPDDGDFFMNISK